MKIGIDCRMIGSKNAGMGRYIEQLVKNILEIDTNNQYCLFVKDRADPVLNKIKDKSNIKLITANIPWYSFAEQFRFKKIINKQKLDLMHFPHFNVPYFFRGNFVVTIHDLIMYHFSRAEATTLGPIRFWLKDMAHRILLHQVVKRATYIISTSYFSRQDLINVLLVDPKKIIVTYQAPFVENNKNNLDFDFAKFNIKKDFVLYVGNAYPHKNLEKLLLVWDILEKKYNIEKQLVLVGRENYFYERLKKNKLAQKKSIIFTGYIEDKYLPSIYSNASLYVFPSLYEGFGLPPLEAQVFSVPVVSSNSSCLPEILGEGALYFDPDSADNMANVINTALTDRDIRYDLIQNARENSSRFSWLKLAKDTLDIYKNSI